MFNLFYPHYYRAIDNDVDIRSHFGNGIFRHIITYYFWDNSEPKSESLLLKIIEKNDPNTILKLVNLISRQEKYTQGLDEIIIKNFENKILKLWSELAEKYENARTEEEKQVLVALVNLLKLAPELNEVYTNLVLKSTRIPFNIFRPQNLMNILDKMKDIGEASTNAIQIGTILESIQFESSFSSSEYEHIKNLVIFLYQNNQDVTANRFCNKIAKRGDQFLYSTYNRFNT